MSVLVMKCVRGTDTGPLFTPIGSVERTEPHMTERNVSQMLAKRSRQADVKRVLARDLRHTAIADKFRAGFGYLDIRQMFGPMRVDTLARHDVRNYCPSPPSHSYQVLRFRNESPVDSNKVRLHLPRMHLADRPNQPEVKL